MILSRGTFEEALKAAAWETACCWDVTARGETAAYAELGRAARRCAYHAFATHPNPSPSPHPLPLPLTRCAYHVFAMDTFTRDQPHGASGSRLGTSSTSLAVLQQLRACRSATLTLALALLIPIPLTPNP